MKIPAIGFTHGGRFHADDVFSTALLEILNPDFKVTRGFEVPENFEGIVYDIGFGEFDHHQDDREIRPNGVPYAALGLIWREFGNRLLDDNQARLFDENFIQPLDICDNTGKQDSLCDAIGVFNPVWDNTEDVDICFVRAVVFAKQVLNLRLENSRAISRADDLVRKAYSESTHGIVEFNQYLPWKNGLYRTDACFVVYPSQRGGFSAQCVSDHRTKTSKFPFPASWAGKSPEIIEAKSGIKGIKFCHPNRFLITTDTKQTAIAACMQVLKNYGKI